MTVTLNQAPDYNRQHLNDKHCNTLSKHTTELMKQLPYHSGEYGYLADTQHNTLPMHITVSQR